MVKKKNHKGIRKIKSPKTPALESKSRSGKSQRLGDKLYLFNTKIGEKFLRFQKNISYIVRDLKGKFQRQRKDKKTNYDRFAENQRKVKGKIDRTLKKFTKIPYLGKVSEYSKKIISKFTKKKKYSPKNNNPEIRGQKIPNNQGEKIKANPLRENYNNDRILDVQARIKEIKKLNNQELIKILRLEKFSDSSILLFLVSQNNQKNKRKLIPELIKSGFKKRDIIKVLFNPLGSLNFRKEVKQIQYKLLGINEEEIKILSTLNPVFGLNTNKKTSYRKLTIFKGYWGLLKKDEKNIDKLREIISILDTAIVEKFFTVSEISNPLRRLFNVNNFFDLSHQLIKGLIKLHEVSEKLNIRNRINNPDLDQKDIKLFISFLDKYSLLINNTPKNENTFHKEYRKKITDTIESYIKTPQSLEIEKKYGISRDNYDNAQKITTYFLGLLNSFSRLSKKSEYYQKVKKDIYVIPTNKPLKKEEEQEIKDRFLEIMGYLSIFYEQYSKKFNKEFPVINTIRLTDDENIAGSYLDGTDHITLNYRYLKNNNEDIGITIMHELFHPIETMSPEAVKIAYSYLFEIMLVENISATTDDDDSRTPQYKKPFEWDYSGALYILLRGNDIGSEFLTVAMQRLGEKEKYKFNQKNNLSEDIYREQRYYLSVIHILHTISKELGINLDMVDIKPDELSTPQKKNQIILPPQSPKTPPQIQPAKPKKNQLVTLPLLPEKPVVLNQVYLTQKSDLTNTANITLLDKTKREIELVKKITQIAENNNISGLLQVIFLLNKTNVFNNRYLTGVKFITLKKIKEFFIYQRVTKEPLDNYLIQLADLEQKTQKEKKEIGEKVKKSQLEIIGLKNKKYLDIILAYDHDKFLNYYLNNDIDDKTINLIISKLERGLENNLFLNKGKFTLEKSRADNNYLGYSAEEIRLFINRFKVFKQIDIKNKINLNDKKNKNTLKQYSNILEQYLLNLSLLNPQAKIPDLEQVFKERLNKLEQFKSTPEFKNLKELFFKGKEQEYSDEKYLLALYVYNFFEELTKKSQKYNFQDTIKNIVFEPSLPKDVIEDKLEKIFNVYGVFLQLIKNKEVEKGVDPNSFMPVKKVDIEYGIDTLASWVKSEKTLKLNMKLITESVKRGLKNSNLIEEIGKRLERSITHEMTHPIELIDTQAVITAYLFILKYTNLSKEIDKRTTSFILNEVVYRPDYAGNFKHMRSGKFHKELPSELLTTTLDVLLPKILETRKTLDIEGLESLMRDKQKNTMVALEILEQLINANDTQNTQNKTIDKSILRNQIIKNIKEEILLEQNLDYINDINKLNRYLISQKIDKKTTIMYLSLMIIVREFNKGNRISQVKINQELKNLGYDSEKFTTDIKDINQRRIFDKNIKEIQKKLLGLSSEEDNLLNQIVVSNIFLKPNYLKTVQNEQNLVVSTSLVEKIKKGIETGIFISEEILKDNPNLRNMVGMTNMGDISRQLSIYNDLELGVKLTNPKAKKKTANEINTLVDNLIKFHSDKPDLDFANPDRLKAELYFKVESFIDSPEYLKIAQELNINSEKIKDKINTGLAFYFYQMMQNLREKSLNSDTLKTANPLIDSDFPPSLKEQFKQVLEFYGAYFDSIRRLENEENQDYSLTPNIKEIRKIKANEKDPLRELTTSGFWKLKDDKIYLGDLSAEDYLPALIHEMSHPIETMVKETATIATMKALQDTQVDKNMVEGKGLPTSSKYTDKGYSTDFYALKKGSGNSTEIFSTGMEYYLLAVMEAQNTRNGKNLLKLANTTPEHLITLINQLEYLNKRLKIN